jgi:DNA-3-methyladenine glycosylase
MYGPPGRAYVYLVYGMHDCLNIVTQPAGSPAALLVRAVEPLEGVDLMRAARVDRTRTRRHSTGTLPAGPARAGVVTPDTRLASGPGLVCAAFDLDRTLTGQDLFDPAAPIRIVAPPAGEAAPVIVAGPRVGIGYAGQPWIDVPWRLSIAGHPSVSRPLPLLPG